MACTECANAQALRRLVASLAEPQVFPASAVPLYTSPTPTFPQATVLHRFSGGHCVTAEHPLGNRTSTSPPATL